MPLKKSKGNMYDWVSHTHSHLGGECPHKCVYCYVQRNRFGIAPRYQGEPRLIEPELNRPYGVGKTIFIEHMNDMFADAIKDEWIDRILAHCAIWDKNNYVFQTKNPERAWEFSSSLPKDSLIGTTIETNYAMDSVSKAPHPDSRRRGIKWFSSHGHKTFVTIEPILEFDISELSKWIIDIKPSFVNIGADSKGCGLVEPTGEKVMQLVKALQDGGITIRKKVNLARLMK